MQTHKEVELYPDAYQYESAERLGISRRGIGYALKRLGMSRKKTFSHPKADKVARETFENNMQAHQKAGFCRVNVDESGFSHDMPRQYGYAPDV